MAGNAPPPSFQFQMALKVLVPGMPPPVLTPKPAGSNPLEGLTTGSVKRCPGAASQPASDGSSPWSNTDGALDCDPSLVPPGP